MSAPVICGECNMEFEEQDAGRLPGVCSACDYSADRDDALELAAWRAVAFEVDRLGNGDGSIGVARFGDGGTLQYGAFVCGNVSMADEDWYPTITELADALGLEWRS